MPAKLVLLDGTNIIYDSMRAFLKLVIEYPINLTRYPQDVSHTVLVWEVGVRRRVLWFVVWSSKKAFLGSHTPTRERGDRESHVHRHVEEEVPSLQLWVRLVGMMSRVPRPRASD